MVVTDTKSNKARYRAAAQRARQLAHQHSDASQDTFFEVALPYKACTERVPPRGNAGKDLLADDKVQEHQVFCIMMCHLQSLSLGCGHQRHGLTQMLCAMSITIEL